MAFVRGFLGVSARLGLAIIAAAFLLAIALPMDTAAQVQTQPAPVSRNKTELTLVEYTPLPATFSGASEKIAYSYKIKNTGSLLIIRFELTDTRATSIRCPHRGPLAIGAEITCTGGAHITTPADVGRQVVESAANVTGSSVAGATDSAAAAANKVAKVNFIASKPKLTLSVTPAPATFSVEGEKITYTYTVRNTGKAPLATFTLTGNKAAGIDCQPANSGPLAAGASATCTGTYTTRVSDRGKNIASTASVTGTSATGAAAPVQARAVVKYVKPKVAARPEVAMIQYNAVPRTFSAANQKITYYYSLFNPGDVPVTGYTVTDSKVRDIKCPPARTGPNGGPLTVKTAVWCTGTYITTAADVGKDIASMSSVSGMSASGPASVTGRSSRNTVVKYVKPKVVAKPNLRVFKIKPIPGTFSAANQKIDYIIIIQNLTDVPATAFSVSGRKITDIKCQPARGGPAGVVKGINFAGCTGTYMTTAADVGKDIESQADVTAKSAAGLLLLSSRSSNKAVVKFVAQP